MTVAAFLVTVGVCAAVGIIGTLRAVYTDGYRRRPDREYGDQVHR